MFGTGRISLKGKCSLSLMIDPLKASKMGFQGLQDSELKGLGPLSFEA